MENSLCSLGLNKTQSEFWSERLKATHASENPTRDTLRKTYRSSSHLPAYWPTGGMCSTGSHMCTQLSEFETGRKKVCTLSKEFFAIWSKSLDFYLDDTLKSHSSWTIPEVLVTVFSVGWRSNNKKIIRIKLSHICKYCTNLSLTTHLAQRCSRAVLSLKSHHCKFCSSM